MVSSTVTENGEVEEVTKVCTALGVPPGDYRLVGWDMDTTGKRLVDEICQIAGYTPDSTYSQYVMPFKDLSPPAMRRHSIKVVTLGKYRALKNTKTNKVLKTKSEISALMEFLAWLESVKGDATDGIILVYHEPRKVIPAMIIEAMTKYNLLNRFKIVVKGFANGFEISKAKCANTLNIFSLRTLSRVFLDKEEELDSAVHRARLALQIVQHLSVGEENGKQSEEIGSGDNDAANKATVEFLREFVQPVSVEEEEYAALKVVLARQNSMKPIFGPLLKMARRERQHASPLRRLLAESAIDYIQLQEAWTNEKREGLEKLVKEKVTAENKDIEDLMQVLECHFDPEKNFPIVGDKNNKKSRRVKSEKKKNGKCNSENESPDTTTSHWPAKENSDVPTTRVPTIQEVAVAEGN